MKTLLKNASIWHTDHTFLSGADVLICDGIIEKVEKNIDECADKVIDISGKYIVPGFVDAHTHGRAGSDFNVATQHEMEEMKRDYIRHGVTSPIPTLASDTLEGWEDSAKKICATGFDGIHFEGRYLSEKKKGAHALHLLSLPSAHEIEKITSWVNIPTHITLAPELQGSDEAILSAVNLGATVGIGHTNATASETRRALTLGASSFSHLFNAMPALHHREGGAVAVALMGGTYSELIVDGVHICPDMVSLAYSCIGAERFVLITDSMAGTGCADGEYSIAGGRVFVKDGKATTPDGTIAGSTLNMLDAVKNLMNFAGATLGDAIACATKNPAKMLGIYDKVGSIEVGKRANLLVLDKDVEILKVIYEGEEYI